MVRQTIRRRTSLSIRWAVLESIGVGLLGAISLLLLARLLGPDDFGMVSLALALITFAEFWVTAPFSESLIQRRPLQPQHLDSAFWAMTGLGVLACCACELLSGAIAQAYSRPLLQDLLSAYGFVLILAGLNGLPTIMLQRELNYRELAKSTLSGRVVGLWAAVGLALLGYGVWSIVIGDLVGKAVATGVLWTRYRYQPSLRLSPPHLHELLRFGWITTLESLLWSLAIRAFIAGLGYFHGVTALGYLNLAMRLTDMVHQLLHGVTQRLLLPVFSALQNDTSSLKRAVERTATAVVAVNAPTFFGIAAVAPAAIETVFGASWLPAVPLVWILCLYWVLSGTVATIGPYLKSIGKPLPMLVPALVACMISLPVALASGHLTLLAAVAIFSTRILVNAPMLLCAVREAGAIRIGKYLASISKPLLAASAMAVSVWEAGSLLPSLGAWPNLLASIAFGAVVYCALLRVLDKQTVKWIWTFSCEAARIRTSSGPVAPAGARP